MYPSTGSSFDFVVSGGGVTRQSLRYFATWTVTSCFFRWGVAQTKTFAIAGEQISHIIPSKSGKILPVHDISREGA